MPFPYVARALDVPGDLHSGRASECTRDFLCQVCGLEVTEDRCGIATGAPTAEKYISMLEVEADHGLTHVGCARMTVKFCPAFRDGYITPMAMWLVDTASLQGCWARFVSDSLPSSVTRTSARPLMLGQLAGVERLLSPAELATAHD
jgi:hypothetical protein